MRNPIAIIAIYCFSYSFSATAQAGSYAIKRAVDISSKTRIDGTIIGVLPGKKLVITKKSSMAVTISHYYSLQGIKYYIPTL